MNCLGLSIWAIAPIPQVVMVTRKNPKSIVFLLPKVFFIEALNGTNMIWATENTERIIPTSFASSAYPSPLVSHILLSTYVGRNDTTFYIIIFPTHSENKHAKSIFFLILGVNTSLLFASLSIMVWLYLLNSDFLSPFFTDLLSLFGVFDNPSV